MAIQDCKNELIKTGFFGFGDEAQRTVEDVIDRLVNDRSLYYSDGSLSPTRAVAALNDFIEAERVSNRISAREQYLTRKAIADTQSRLDTWKKEAAAQGKNLSISDLFDILLFGSNMPQTLTGGKISIETVSRTYANNYAQELQEAFKPLVDKYGNGLSQLLGIPDNILKDAGRAIKELANKDLLTERRNFNLNVMRALEGQEIDDVMAKDVATMISRMYKKIAFDINKTGGKINILENYNPHDHSPEKLIATGMDEWKTEIKSKLNWKETYPAEYSRFQAENKILGIDRDFADSESADEFLTNVYWAITDGKSTDFDSRGFRPNPRITRNFERGRSLQFIDGNHYAEYANKYSTVDPMFTLLSKMRAAASTRAAYETLGARPEETLQSLIKIAQEDVKADKTLSSKEQSKILENLRGNNLVEGSGAIGRKWHSLMGYNERPINSTFYNISSGLRSFETLKLGASPFSALFGDLITGSVQTRRVTGQGSTLLSVIQTMVQRINFSDREVVDEVGIMAEDMFRAQNRHQHPDSLEENRGLINTYTSMFMRFSFLQNVTQNARAASNLIHMGAVAKNRHLSFNELHADVVHDLKQADISEKEWDLIRKNFSVSGSGREYVLPKDTRKLTNEDIDPLLPDEFRGDKEPTLDYEAIEKFADDLLKKYKVREIRDALSVDKRLTKLDRRIVSVHKRLGSLEDIHNARFATERQNIQSAGAELENKLVGAVLERAFAGNQKLRSKARTITKKLDQLVTSSNNVFAKKKDALQLQGEQRKAQLIQDNIKRVAGENLKLRKKVKDIGDRIASIEKKGKRNVPERIQKLSEERGRLLALVKEDLQDEFKEIEARVDVETAGKIRELTHETAVKFDKEKKQFEATRRELLGMVSDASDVDIRNARYDAIKQTEKKLNELHDKTAKSFDKERRNLTSSLKDLRKQRVERRNKYIEQAREVTTRMEAKDAEKLQKFLTNEKQKVDRWFLDKQKARESARDSLELKAKRYYTIGDTQAVVQQSARSKYITTLGGTKRGTVVGEAARAAFQFKEQAITTFNLLLKERRIGSTAGGVENVMAHLGFIGTSLFFGYGLMTTKDIARGRTPRDISRPGTWVDMLIYSGGFGFLFDVLFNDNRGYGNIGSMFGPVGGDLGEIAKAMYTLTNAMKPGSDTTAEDVGNEFLKVGYKVGVKNLVPRLWYTRNVADYYVLNPIEEAINPGVFKRRAAAMRKKTGQEYLAGWAYHK